MEHSRLNTALDLDLVTHHLKAIQHCRFFGHRAILSHHRVAIDECIEKTLLPYEIKEALKSFYRIDRLTEWLFYAEHIDNLLEQYGIAIFYWSSVESIQTYSDMYLVYEMGLSDDRIELGLLPEIMPIEPALFPVNPEIIVTHHL